MSRSTRPRAPHLMEQAHEAAHLRHYSIHTEEAFARWIRAYIQSQVKRHPREMDAAECSAFPTHLPRDRRLAASTQEQALAALLFLHRRVLGVDLPWLDHLDRAKKKRRLLVVLSRQQVTAVLRELHGPRRLPPPSCMARASGCWRVSVCASRTSAWPSGRSRCGRARPTRIGRRCCQRPWTTRCRPRSIVWRTSTRRMCGGARGGWSSPMHWAANSRGRAVSSPGSGHSRGRAAIGPPDTGQRRRHRLLETLLQRAMREAVLRAGIHKRATCHTLRHSFPTHLMEHGVRPPHGTGAAGPREPADDEDLHPRAVPPCRSRATPSRWAHAAAG